MLAGLCAFASESIAASGQLSDSTRVIVRFRSDVVDAADPAFLEALARAAHVERIESIRPMSGDAYVMRIGCHDPRRPAGASDASCDAAIARVAAVESVLMIEPDGRETIRNQR